MKRKLYVSILEKNALVSLFICFIMTECSQKLYVRLFSRKLMWRMQSKVKYPQIAEDLSSYLKELIDVGFGMSG